VLGPQVEEALLVRGASSEDIAKEMIMSAVALQGHQHIAGMKQVRARPAAVAGWLG
jgi:hypothetical protein